MLISSSMVMLANSVAFLLSKLLRLLAIPIITNITAPVSNNANIPTANTDSITPWAFLFTTIIFLIAKIKITIIRATITMDTTSNPTQLAR
ncbi:MAG: hypothetical protein US68_C0006G0017 [Candidatus Shapirobacteria bacterium GW2011_GWE1_38_10]|uniref:Uncharacterized protein n=1 Tax=Candidatus Shapirobacteria bacterium GW2011_GWE1_38_10 TaxID=1618488 RepID=A0A0G0I715_9BACT|nr:MAG: hypothetical protein US68_C0006G0017 [Candidatus Shapirobacteria bacterium GW2011_GWE1_38_10]KKQ65160.1 MAG: hypothetical protein US85_C0001G0087 [Candidatus Shapirobacteria bacterium GW2011_GWF1_38_23]